jgi:hypothetical protein
VWGKTGEFIFIIHFFRKLISRHISNYIFRYFTKNKKAKRNLSDENLVMAAGNYDVTKSVVRQGHFHVIHDQENRPTAQVQLCDNVDFITGQMLERFWVK